MLSCFGGYGVLCAVVNCSFCRVTPRKMKHSVDNSDLTKDHDHTKGGNRWTSVVKVETMSIISARSTYINQRERS